MEKLLSNELTKYIIILSAGGLALSLITAKLMSKLKGSVRLHQKSTVLYILIFLVFFGIIALTAMPMFYHKTLTSLIICQAYFLLLGSFHVYFLNTTMAWGGEENEFLPAMFLTLLISSLGGIVFLMVFHRLNKNGMEFIMASSIILFIVPFFFYNTFRKTIAIPPKVWKQWYYPVSEEVEEPEESKMKNLLVISFEFQKNYQDPQLTNFRANAPRDMEFGQLFYFFINDYNELHTNSRIQYSNGSGEPQGWVFYKKPRWYSITTKYIDTEKTIFANKIHGNDVIICTQSKI